MLYRPAWNEGGPGARLMAGGGDDKAARLDAEWSTMMAAAQGGDRAAYERLLRGCTPLVRRIVRHQGVPTDRVDDVAQEVLLTVHRARQTYDPTRSFSAWLCAIARHRAIDGLRRHGRQDRREVHAPLDYENHPAPEPERQGEAGQAQWLRSAVDHLPDGQREAIEALALRQLSLDEASLLTGKSKGALKVNMHRALRTLRARFGNAE